VDGNSWRVFSPSLTHSLPLFAPSPTHTTHHTYLRRTTFTTLAFSINKTVDLKCVTRSFFLHLGKRVGREKKKIATTDTANRSLNSSSLVLFINLPPPLVTTVHLSCSDNFFLHRFLPFTKIKPLIKAFSFFILPGHDDLRPLVESSRSWTVICTCCEMCRASEQGGGGPGRSGRGSEKTRGKERKGPGPGGIRRRGARE
jgi:hypothetical protein